MAQLAIKGHPSRNREVVELLEMLGGKNIHDYECNVSDYAYIINKQGIIDLYIPHPNSSFAVFTLEEFLEKFPYKVGDKVYHIIHNENQIITNLVWQEDEVIYLTNTNEYAYVNYLQPYKEKTMEKINVAKLLEDCPQGMELDCPMYDNLYFKCIREHPIYPIVCYTIDSKGEEYEISFNWYGKHAMIDTSKCVIFPKGKTTWEGFHRPFKDGDVIATKLGSIFIFKESSLTNIYNCYVALNYESKFIYKEQEFGHKNMCRFATEEEKEKLFKAIKDNGYKWNPEIKELEKLIQPKFKVGDWVTDGATKCQIHFIDDTQYWYSKNCILGSIESVDERYHLWTINDAKDGNVISYDSGWICIFKHIHGVWYSSYCFITSEGEFHTGYEEHAIYATINGNAHPATEEQCRFLFRKIKEKGYEWNPYTKTLKEPFVRKFRVGDKIRGKYTHNIYTISCITPTEYNLTNGQSFTFDDEDCYELVLDKFDITTLKPFDKVLARCSTLEKWRIQLFEKYDKTYQHPFVCIGCNKYKQCIPYEGNEHLLDTADNCTDYFKTWE